MARSEQSPGPHSSERATAPLGGARPQPARTSRARRDGLTATAPWSKLCFLHCLGHSLHEINVLVGRCKALSHREGGDVSSSDIAPAQGRVNNLLRGFRLQQVAMKPEALRGAPCLLHVFP